jgi:protein phosphatase
MPADGPDTKTPQPGSLQAMLARLRGMVQVLKSPEAVVPEQGEVLPTWDAVAAPIEAAPATTVVPSTCPQCSGLRQADQTYCDNCGWIFPPAAETTSKDNGAGSTEIIEQSSGTERVVTSPEPARLRGRYELGVRFGSKATVERFRGLDFPSTNDAPVAVIILRASRPPLPEAVATANAVAEVSETEETSGVNWPSLSWEKALLQAAASPGLPRIIDHFPEGEMEYLVEELPQGQVLWDAWDNPAVTMRERFTWLRQVAETFRFLHHRGAILEGLRPDIVIVDGAGRARLTDLSDLLPLPLPPDPPIRATCYTAPELVLNSEKADARADLYSFGAMLYALHLGRELTDLDFELQGLPKSILHRFPDIHPVFGRLVSKTFCRELSQRFPSEEAAAMDPTGFQELIETLDLCARTLDDVRLGIAAWTTTGMVRTGNEDSFAVLTASEARQNGLYDCALILLADGMGGSEAGEVAAAMAIETMRSYLLQQEAFGSLGKPPNSAPLPAVAEQPHATEPEGTPTQSASEGSPPGEENQPQAPQSSQLDLHETLLVAALKEANQKVHAVARSDAQKSGMGCTAEAVYLSGRQIVVAHVGDSRTYHLHRGQLVQLTQDQTWVNRMVELGVLTAEEAATHPRRSELQQAIGGYPEVEPAVCRRPLHAGDWVLVCSDGITNHLPNEVLQEILERSSSPEAAARRLVNLVNLHGATDNATAVVIRAS